MQVEHRHALGLRHGSGSLGVGLEVGADPAVLLVVAPCQRGQEHRHGPGRAGLVHVAREVLPVRRGGIGLAVGSLSGRVVVAELDQHVVRPVAQDLPPEPLGGVALRAAAALGPVEAGGLRRQTRCEAAPPALLVGDGRIASQRDAQRARLERPVRPLHHAPLRDRVHAPVVSAGRLERARVEGALRHLRHHRRGLAASEAHALRASLARGSPAQPHAVGVDEAPAVLGARQGSERQDRGQARLRVPAPAEGPARVDLLLARRSLGARQVVGEPGVVAPLAPAARVVVAGAPLVALGSRGQVHRPVGQARREEGVEHVDLPVAVVAPEGEARDAVEARVAHHQLLLSVLAAVVPESRREAATEEAAVGDVGPAARADEVDRPLEVAGRLVRQPGGAVPQAQRVAAVGGHRGVQERDAGGPAARAHRELVVVVAVEPAVVVAHREVGQHQVADLRPDVDHRRAPVVGVRLAPGAPQLGVLEARAGAALADERDVAARDEDLLAVDAVTHEHELVGGVALGDRVERGLDRAEVAAAVLRHHEVHARRPGPGGRTRKRRRRAQARGAAQGQERRRRARQGGPPRLREPQRPSQPPSTASTWPCT